MKITTLQLNINMLYNSVKYGKLKDDFDEESLPTHWQVYLAPINGKDVPVLTYDGDIFFKDKDIIHTVLPNCSFFIKDDTFRPIPKPIKEILLATATHI